MSQQWLKLVNWVPIKSKLSSCTERSHWISNTENCSKTNLPVISPPQKKTKIQALVSLWFFLFWFNSEDSELLYPWNTRKQSTSTLPLLFWKAKRPKHSRKHDEKPLASLSLGICFCISGGPVAPHPEPLLYKTLLLSSNKNVTCLKQFLLVILFRYIPVLQEDALSHVCCNMIWSKCWPNSLLGSINTALLMPRK